MSEEKTHDEAEESRSERASKMMGGMLKGLREFGTAAKEKAEEFGKLASEKAEELTKLGKIKLDIHQLNRSRSKALTELGELVLNLGNADKLGELAEHENYLALVKSIAALDAEIAEKEQKAAEVEHEEGKAEVKIEEK